MIPAGVQVFVALEPIDMRLGFERLSGWVREHIGYDARSGALYVFVGKRRETLKVLFFDGSGMCIFAKRLDQGTFARLQAPSEGASHLEVDEATFDAMLDGIEVQPTSEATRARPRRVH